MSKSRRNIQRPTSHILIPDLQVRADVDYSHLRAIGNYIVDARPDAVVQIGDWPDLISLASFDKGKLSAEGRRLRDDIRSVRESVDLLMDPIRKYNRTHRKKYNPRLYVTEGNHDLRLRRFSDENPAFADFFGDDVFGFKGAGFTVFPFLQIAKIDTIEYVHYLPASGRPGAAVTTAAGLLRARHTSISVGHSHKVEIFLHSNTHHIGLISGAAYQHFEGYAHGADDFKRGIWRKSEIRHSTYDPMFVSLDYLKRRWM